VTRKLVIATNNPGKLREFQKLLDGCGFELVTPRELGVNFDPEETGSTFAENATMKAVEAALACRLPALADDSGLEVDHLGGRPGIFSARYAGRDRTDPGISEARQLELLLEEMQGVPDAQRSARFRCVIAIATPGGGVQLVDGVWEGRIAHEARGTHGFGYDPVFVADGRDVTSAQLPREEKNRISHRGQAATKARELLRKMSDDRATA
jgi:XTP/dITP diphosphohydrolase